MSIKENKFMELGRYKNEILIKLLDDVDIVKALNYPTPNFLDEPALEDPTVLMYKQLYPLPYIPDFQSEEGTFLTMEMTGFQNINREFKSGFLHVNIFSNIGIWATAYGVNRIDYLGSKIYELLNEKKDMGIGKLEWVGWESYRPDQNILGVTVSFRVVDFQ